MNETRTYDNVYCDETEMYLFGAKIIYCVCKRLAPVHFMTFSCYWPLLFKYLRTVRWSRRSLHHFFCIKNYRSGAAKELQFLLNLG
jgi:hypothetical protein